MNQLGSRDEAEDAVQSTFLNAHRAIQRGVTPDAELAWLFKIAHNVCLTRRRSTRRRGRVEAPSDLGAVQDLLPAPVRESADDLIRLTDALAHMPDNQRRAILLREWQGLSYHEIAGELKLSQSAVETLIFRARRTLAANLEAEPERAGLLARARHALDLGTLAAAAKALLGGGAAVKAAATAVAVSGAVVVATAPAEHAKPAAQKQAAPFAAPVSAKGVSDAVAPAATFGGEFARRAAPAAPEQNGDTYASRRRAVAPATPAPAEPEPSQPAPAAAAAEAAPSVEPAAAQAAPAAAPAARSHGGGKGHKKSESPAAPQAAPAAQPPAQSEQSRGRGNGNGHVKQAPPGQAKKAAPEPVAAPAPQPAPAPAAPPEAVAAPVDDPGNGNGNGNGGGADGEHGHKK